MTDEGEAESRPPGSRRPTRGRNISNRVNVAVISTSGRSGDTPGNASQVVSSRQHVRVVQRDGRTEVSEVRVVAEEEDTPQSTD